MEFIEELLFAGERGLESRADFFITGIGMSETVAFKDAAGVGVRNKDGMLAGVEKDGVGGFRADATQGKELFAERAGRCGEKMTQRSAVFLREESCEGFEGFGFLPKVAGRAEVDGELGWGDPADSGEGQQLGVAQVGDGAFDVFPGSVLGEDGAYDNFEAGAAGPPVLRAMGSEERVIVGM